MDSLLVFGGLFAAVLTPFNVESYTFLKPDPTGPSLAVLLQISAQLNSFSVNTPFVNSTAPYLPLANIELPFYPSDSVIMINKLWFSSLICTLASSSIALFVKQWLYELSRGLFGSNSRSMARRRQYRYNGLKKWHLETIFLIPFIFLQAALILFLSGLLVLLWTLDRGVATVAAILAGILFLFLIAMTVLPVFSTSGYTMVPFLTPSLIAGWILRGISDAILRFLQSHAITDQVTLESRDRTLFFYKLLRSWSDCFPTWSDREGPIVRARGTLDCSTAVMAFTSTLDEEHLKHLPVVIQDIPAAELGLAFDEIVAACYREEPNTMGPSLRRERVLLFLERSLIRALGCLLTDPHIRIGNAISPAARRHRIAPICISLLSRLTIMEFTDKNGVIEVLGPAFDLQSPEVTQLAYSILLDVLDLWDTGARLSYTSIRYALSSLESDLGLHQDILTMHPRRVKAAMSARSAPSGFPGVTEALKHGPETMNYNVAITRQLRTVRGVILCALEALSTTTPLSLKEVRIVCDHTKRLLSLFGKNWSSISSEEWKSLLSPAPKSDDEKQRNFLPLSLHQYLWPPLFDLLENPRSYIVLPDEMMDALKIALENLDLKSWEDPQPPFGRADLRPDVVESSKSSISSTDSPRYLYHLAHFKVRSIETALKKLSHEFEVRN
uniref:Cytochrome P450 monooxygenase AKT7 ) n=1 Tax=Ganoderma boninense TaxID=34458 RepID=A0A5K1JXU6_9APHY|nr:Cytochrome P450 monooxygenase AKT7 (EC (AK-toxin biosynthesis protein 7) [Ganoderma boninense]